LKVDLAYLPRSVCRCATEEIFVFNNSHKIPRHMNTINSRNAYSIRSFVSKEMENAMEQTHGEIGTGKALEASGTANSSRHGADRTSTNGAIQIMSLASKTLVSQGEQPSDR
jgi:hypothetical protein